MSSEKLEIEKKNSYVERLVEICGTKQPMEMAQILDISYQAARNYLRGRLPETEVLLKIAEKTSYSVHWLLTGEGEKFIPKQDNLNTLILSDQMRAFVRQECLEVFNEIFEKQIENSQEKIVKLASNQIKAEKKINEISAPSQNNPKNF
ncbi:MAG TPA: helix-turn-helix domain-containing protein [Pyrinomonadaceae bacterium]|nr:helix-turn-helix domain-containing protein [Pyrinomonadaceae bacterium]